MQKGILSAKALAELPPVKQRLYQDNPINGRRALYIGAHAGFIVGWPQGDRRGAALRADASAPTGRSSGCRMPGARAT